MAVVEWVKTRKEITAEKLEAASKGGAKVKIRKGKSSHAKAQKMAKVR